MAIHEWWAGDGTERYWMEITNRSDLGSNLLAPKLDDAGNEYWSYTLVNYVKPGDLVFHWDKNEGPAIVGFSVVGGQPRSSTILWQSRGTYGRAHAPSGREPAWLAPLSGYVDLETPLTQDLLRAAEAKVRRVRDRLENKHGSPIYFPYALSNKRPLRAAQGYLTKFPRALVEQFAELGPAADLGKESPEERRGSRTFPKSSKGAVNRGRLTDAARKKAIEMHAVRTVMDLWIADGFFVEDVGLRESWDITATKGASVVHIEVKGSSGTRDAVDLTDGEVRHSEGNAGTVLAVVDQIRVGPDNSCSGGRVRIWRDWVPDRGVLVATAYRYPLPLEDEG